MSATNVLISVGATTAGAVTELDKVTGALGRQMTSAEKASKVIRSAAVPAGLALAGIGTAAISSVKGAEEAAAANAKLAEVFKSMGYSENTKAASDYAEALSKTIGVDDEVIKGAQTKLATFSEVAKSADVMQKATTLAADLSAAGFGDMSSQSVLLGKALQDPIKGVGALSKVGVTFTDQQKEQIAAMVKAGDTVGAQKIIMGELEKQVGGVAEASATSSAKLGVAFGEISEAVGTALLPAFEALMGPLQAFATWASENPGVLLAIGAAIGVVAGAIVVMNVAMTVWQAVTTAVSIANAILGTSFTLALGPVLLIIAAIAAVIAIGVLLWKNWDTITAALSAAWEWIKATAETVWNGIKDFFATTWDAITAKVEAVWNAITAFFGIVWNAIVTVVQTYIDTVQTIISTVFEAIKTAIETYVNLWKSIILTAWTLIQTGVDTAINAVRTVIDTVMETIRTGIDTVTKAIKALFSGDFGALKDIVDKALGNVLTLIKDLPGKITEALSGLGTLLYDKGQALIQGLIDGIKSMLTAVSNAAKSVIPDWLPGGKASVTGGGASTGSTTRALGRSGFLGASTYAGSRGNVVINLSGGSAEENARALKRALEGYDVRQGRARGKPLAVSW